MIARIIQFYFVRTSSPKSKCFTSSCRSPSRRNILSRARSFLRQFYGKMIQRIVFDIPACNINIVVGSCKFQPSHYQNHWFNFINNDGFTYNLVEFTLGIRIILNSPASGTLTMSLSDGLSKSIHLLCVHQDFSRSPSLSCPSQRRNGCQYQIHTLAVQSLSRLPRSIFCSVTCRIIIHNVPAGYIDLLVSNIDDLDIVLKNIMLCFNLIDS